MFKNAQINAELKNLDVESLIIQHIQVNIAPQMCLCAYRAHSWNNPHMSSTCHAEMVPMEEE